MKILFFLRDISDCGGVQQTTVINGNRIKKAGFDIEMLSLYHKNENPFFPINKEINTIKIFERPVDNKKDFLTIYKNVNDKLSKIDFDILVIQAVPYASFVNFKKYRHKKIVVCEHEHYGLGHICGLHWIGERKACKLADAIVTLTKLDRNNYKSHVSRNTRLLAIGNSYEPLNEEVKYSDDSKVIVSCGSLVPLKCFDLAIQVASKVLKKHPDWTWEIYGDGPEKEKLQTLISENDLKGKLSLKGYESNKEKIYNGKSLFVMTSSFEGFGMVLVEAMQYKLPVISYAVKYGPMEIVENEQSGYLVNYGNIDEMSKKILNLIENKEKRILLSDNTIKCIKRYSPENITNKWIKLFSLLSQER